MRRIDLIQSTTLLVLVFSFIPALSHAQSDLQKQDFFEAKIRPVLIEHCYECHNSHGTKEGDLAVDFKQGLLTGGFNGPAIELNNAAGSTLLQALRHENDLRMPKDGPKLSKQVIIDFQKWIEDGAFDPRNTAPTAKELDSVISWEAVRERRSKWWSFQPVTDPSLPKAVSTSNHPVDLFIQQRLHQEGLPIADRANPITLL